MKTLLEAKNIGFHYENNEKWILRNLNFSISEGDIINVMGRNGSGKSTLLRVLSGDLELKEGEIFNYESPVIYLDQNASKFTSPALTIRDHFKLSGSDNDDIIDIEGILKEFDLGLEVRLDEFVGHLSGGQKQIIALLSTLLSGFKILCLDEFTNNMDQKSFTITIDLIKSLSKKTKLTILFIEHKELNLGTTRSINL